MGKTHRGFGLLETVNRGRGTCPICKRSGIKVVYEHEMNEKKVMICKQCRAALARAKKKEAAQAS